MKRTLFSVAAAIGFSTIPVATLLAQSAAGVYDIPFSFNVQGIQLPAGRYTLAEAGAQFRTLSTHGGTVLLSRNPTLSAKPRPAHLTFSKQGDRYTLREVWQDDGVGTKIKAGAEERQLLSVAGQGQNAPQTILIAATR